MRLNNEDSHTKALVFACTGAVSAAVMAASLLRGMFFAGEIYPFLTVWLALCGLLCAWGEAVSALRNAERRDHVLKIPVENKAALILLGCPLAVFVLYAWAGLCGPVSAQETVDELLRWAFYASFAILAYFCAADRQGARFLAAIWHVTGMAISLSALLAVCAELKLPYAIAYTAAPEVSATGARLAGLLQYPNTFGAVMAVFLLERLFAVAAHVQRAQSQAAEWGAGTKERSGGKGNRGRRKMLGERGNAHRIIERERSGRNGISRRRKMLGERGIAQRIIEWEWSGRKGNRGRRKMLGERGIAQRGIEREWSGRKGNSELRGWCSRAGGRHLLRMLPLFPCAAALLLSESRGAWLAAALASAAALLWKRQLCAPLLLAGAAPMAAAALLYRQLARTGLAVEPVSGLLLLAGLWGAALLGGAWLCRRRTGAAGGGHAARAGLAAALWTAAGSAVLLQVSERIHGPSSTVAARGLFYRDAWKLAAEAPWLGRGGGTWRSTYLAAQSRPYVGSQVHSGYLDLLLNLGGVGLAVILLLLLAAGWLVAAGAPRLLPPLLALAIHSAVDFDWSYSLVWLLLFLLPALARAEKLHHAAADDTPVLPATSNPPPNTGGPGILAAEPGLAPAVPFPVCTATAGAADNSPVRPLSAKSPLITGGPWRSVPFAEQHVPLLRVSAATLLCSVALALSVLSFQMMKGESLYKQAAGTSHREERIFLLRQSLQWNPRQPQAAAALSRMLPEPEGGALLRKALGYTPEDAALNWELAKRAMGGNHPGTALYWVRKGEVLDVYNVVKRVEAAEGMLDMSLRRLKAGDAQGALQSADAGLELLREYRLLAEQEGSKGLQHNDRQFGAQKEAEGIDLRLREARAAARYFQAAILPVSGEGAKPELEP
ncbi:O-antigen ligase family protein [Paenibacillus jilunlii]|uniref:O-Antigen ligase n=1 Tax=Paenibacillus jilunlii TaxID=682956 RepID=A0A1G9ZGI3_9BACL|nr:O-antigen ligase family protein [Paenibacillus jilunlii]SDN20217.1 O-Antigen ligase [Paenibacillus jilunlii]